MTRAHGKNRSAARWKGTSLLLAAMCVLVSVPVLSSCRKKPEAANSPALCSAAYRGDDILVRTLLQQGANVNSRDNSGCTPIAGAAGGGRFSTVTLLLESGADVNAPCASGANPLSVAVYYGHANIVTLLLAKGADVNRAYPGGASVLTSAINEGYTDIVRTLLEKGAEVNHRLTYGETPLILAVQRENETVVRMLLAKGADVRAKAHNEMSALQFAIEKGNTTLAQLLIENGADVNLRASDGFTPIALARSKKLEKIVSLLQAAGAREPQDSFRAAAAEYREKQEKARQEMENKGMEFVVTDADVQYYVKPGTVRKTGNDSSQAMIWEYRFESGELEEISMELNCAERTYRHLSNVLRDASGTVLRVTPVDSYVLNDNGTIRNGTAMDRVWTRVCGGQ